MKYFNILFISLLTLLSGCGDLVKNKVVKPPLTSSLYNVDCELEPSEFAKIMEKNISTQIRCLEANLNLFIKIVETPRPGYLSRVSLEAYLKKNRQDIKPEVVRALKAVFDVNFLITGEDPNFISKDNVKKIIDFALVFNTEASLNFRYFTDKNPISFSLHKIRRDEISKANRKIIMALRQIFNANRGNEIHKLDINELLKSFTTDNNSDDIDTVKKFLFVKKVILGGDKDIITHQELERLLLYFDRLVLITLDGVKYKKILLNQKSLLELLKQDVSLFSDIVLQGAIGNRDKEVFFTVDEAVEVAKEFVSKETLDFDKFHRLIVEAKTIVMGGNETDIQGIDFKNLLTHAGSLLQTGTVFHYIYEMYSATLESPLPVEINFGQYRDLHPELKEEIDKFERIVKKYRFFRGKFVVPYFARNYHRNPEAVFEVALYEYAIQLLFKKYGSPSPNRNSVGGVSISRDQILAIIKKFEDELIDIKLIYPQRAKNVANNIALLGSLFQYQSDDNAVLDVNEATEFGLSLFTSLDIAKDMMSYFDEKSCPKDQFNRIEPNCFRKYFFTGLCDNYRTYFPSFFESLGLPANKSCSEIESTGRNLEFLNQAIASARTCSNYLDGAKEEIYFAEGDIFNIMLGIFHYETTILRWDANENNYMDPDEVNRAYSVFSPALDGFLDDKPAIIKRLKKQIYLYLVKYEKVPDQKDFSSILKFVKFLLRTDKTSNANRKTIASVLVTIGQQSVKPGDPIFNCNYLRDPDNIPHHPPAAVATEAPQSFFDVATEETLQNLMRDIQLEAQ
ncbi:MAG: hypothetical protein AB7I27_10060 [Bacteriovoracaceae bacterium]